MNLELISIMVDVALFILIWLVQWIIYPGFAFADPLSFPHWHASYTKRIAVLVIPLMFGQLGFYGLALLHGPGLITVLQVVLIAVVWLLTFVWIVPLHERLGRALEQQTVRRLLTLNWGRTLGWTCVLLLDLIRLETH